MSVLLVILDGWGLREATPDNAVAAATKPNYDKLIATCPWTKIDGSGPSVGLPVGQMGNSEVGHLNLGAGRIVYQDITRIDKAVDDGSFFDNDVISAAMDRAVVEDKAVHLFGLVSDGGVHSSMKHLFALIDMAKQRHVTKLYLHAFTDGRDTPPDSGIKFIRQVVEKFKSVGIGQISTVMGRYYGMDRDRRWDRTNKAYRAIVYGKCEYFDDPVKAVESAYAAGITDEFIKPSVIVLGSLETGRLYDGDAAIMFNFRADRARQLSYMLAGNEIKGYPHTSAPHVELVTMTNFDQSFYRAKVAFHKVRIKQILAEVLGKSGKKQLRTAETEKYAHVTYFFNGGNEKPFPGEDRDMISSPKVATYDLQPEMSSVEVTDNAVHKIKTGQYDFILLNYANPDMVGHTGVFSAAKKAIEAVDRGLGRLLEAVAEQGGVALVPADHGNSEMMIDPDTGGPWTAHTTNLVPFIVYDPSGKLTAGGKKLTLHDGGKLCDVAPTILEILDIPKPKEMTGHSLLNRG